MNAKIVSARSACRLSGGKQALSRPATLSRDAGEGFAGGYCAMPGIGPDGPAAQLQGLPGTVGAVSGQMYRCAKHACAVWSVAFNGAAPEAG